MNYKMRAHAHGDGWPHLPLLKLENSRWLHHFLAVELRHWIGMVHIGEDEQAGKMLLAAKIH